MAALRRILVAVRDPQAKATPALAKAARLARASGARLELFHALTVPIYADTFVHIDSTFEQIKHDLRERALQQMQRLAAQLDVGTRGRLRVDIAAEWDAPAYEAVIRRAARFGADLVVADLHGGRHIAPGLLQLNDWELLRLCPAPLLLVRSTRAYDRPIVLAAIDPSHALDKPARLDAGILDLATLVGRALRGQVHSVHAFVGAVGGELPTHALDAESAARINARLGRAAARRCERLLTRYRITGRRRHIISLPPADAIEEVAASTRADLVVMGAVSRSGLQRLLVGNTAESLLDRLTCDVLIVKPPRFRNKVRRGMTGARLVPAIPMTP